jgi:hypothetical protein
MATDISERSSIAEKYTQTVCGLSVVPGDWERLKRYNLTELYRLSSGSKGVSNEAGDRTGDTGAASTI